jgi:TetR/AcrR family transcriptional regulator, transcriptional repressor of bet genes
LYMQFERSFKREGGSVLENDHVAADGRKQAIMDAAYSLFGTVGFANTSMKDIAKKAGVAQGLIIYYFQSKDGLLVAIVREWMIGRGIPDALKYLEGITDSDELLLKAFEHVVKFRRDNPQWFTLLISLWLESRRSAELSTQLKNVYSEMRLGAARVVSRAFPDWNSEQIDAFSCVFQAMLDGLTLQIDFEDTELTHFVNNGLSGVKWLTAGRANL